MKTQEDALRQESVQALLIHLAPWDDPRRDIWQDAVVEVPEEYQEFIDRLHNEGCSPSCRNDTNHTPLLEGRWEEDSVS